MIQLQRLEGFYWVARTGGYARAARSFPYPISQPGVHQQVRRLEEELGVRLFERMGKDQMRLTVPGELLFREVAPFYERLKGLEATLKGETYGGVLRIQAAGIFLRPLLPAWIRRLQAKRPDIEVALGELKTPDLSVLRAGEADLLVDHLPVLPPDIGALKIAVARAFLVLPSAHACAQSRTVSWKQLQAEPFIAYNADAALRDLQVHALALHGVRPRVTHAADSADVILGFVAAGIGYSLVPSLEPKGPQVRGVVSRPLQMGGGGFPIYAAWRRTRGDSPLIRAALALAPAFEA